MKIGITGYKGRVGSLLVQELSSGQWNGIELAGGTSRTAKDAPKDIKEDFFVTNDADSLFTRSDAVIDFTTPDATREHIALATRHGTPYIVGTTGLDTNDEQALAEAAQKIPVVYAANMSVGVNVLLALVEKAATLLNEDWDIEIFESHHKHKVDAPSGTALAIGQAAASGRNATLDDIADYARHGHTGPREKGHIGFSVARGGDVVGEHTAYFYGEGERVELSHIATDRALFAKGAIKAALWAHNQSPGLYSMRDVLGL